MFCRLGVGAKAGLGSPLEAHMGRQAAYVVVRLDGGRRTLERHRFDHVGVERALSEPGDVTELPGLILEDRDERRTVCLRR